MSCDVILIADSGIDSFSASNPLKLELDGYPANIQVAKNFVDNNGKVVPPIDGDGIFSWDSAPRLNGIYLYNYLVKRGMSVDLVNNYQKEYGLFRSLARQQPKAVVISTTYMVHRRTIQDLISSVKELCPNSVVIAGGPFVSQSWKIFKKAEKNHYYGTEEIQEQFLFFDASEDLTDLYIVSERGENLLCDALQRIMDGDATWHGLPNSAYVDNNQYVFNTRVDDISDCEDVSIDWADLPKRLFSSKVVPMRASVGCPFRCNFCNFNKDPRLTYVKPLDSLIAELKAVQNRGVKYVWFVDDNFRLGKKDLEAVCQRFIDEGLAIEWMTLIRPEVLKSVDPDLLRKAGCREVQMGIESADPHVLLNMNKQSDPEMNEEILKRLLSAGINCACYFLFGYPGETQESILRTSSFIKRLEEHDGSGYFSWSLYPFLLAPFSHVFDEREHYDLEGYLQHWKHRTMDSDTVKSQLVEIFMSLEHSSPIYRGDNNDFIDTLSSNHGKAFFAARHRLEKLGLLNELRKDTALQILAPIFRTGSQ